MDFYFFRKALLMCVMSFVMCSCSNEHKAKRFIKDLNGDQEYLFQDIDKKNAYVYWESNGVYYQYDIETENSLRIFEIKEGTHTYIGNNCYLGGVDIFYIDTYGNVFRRDLRVNEEVCINNNNGYRQTYVGGYNHSMFFYNEYEGQSCDEKLIEYNIADLTTKYVTFSDVSQEFKEDYALSTVAGHYGLLIILQPKDLYFYVPSYLYYYNFEREDGLLRKLCQSDMIRVGMAKDEIVIITEKDVNTAVIYNLYANVKKECPTIYGWPQHRGLPSGNIIAESYNNNILCYIANDDNNLISSVNLYYYDGNTGEEVVIDSFTQPDGKSVDFVMGANERSHIYTTWDDSGLVFCGETDWGNECALLRFDFATRKVSVIDRGSEVSFTRNRFKVEHHNGTTSWYNTDGEESEPESIVQKSRDYFYDMGAALGNYINDWF